MKKVLAIILSIGTPSRVANYPEIAAYLQEMTAHENQKVQKIAESALQDAAKAS